MYGPSGGGLEGGGLYRSKLYKFEETTDDGQRRCPVYLPAERPKERLATPNRPAHLQMQDLERMDSLAKSSTGPKFKVR